MTRPDDRDAPATASGNPIDGGAEPLPGEPRAPADLLPLVYDELRRVAAAYMRRERHEHSIQATALVHEAYVRLEKDRKRAWQNRAHFCAIAANAMRQILIEHARARAAAKRGGGLARVTLVDELGGPPLRGHDVDIEALDHALDRLAAIDSTQARLVELRYFGGLTIEETAQALGVSPATVKRDWAMARAWLHRELTTGDA